jgi:prepilin-type N-terminal cleavage/methylation domain
MKKSNKGFTLVELIVVLVILAILAAILVPALLGYIDKAREKQVITNAEAAYVAAQAVYTEAYGKRTGVPAEDDMVQNIVNLTDIDEEFEVSIGCNGVTGNKSSFSSSDGNGGMLSHDDYIITDFVYSNDEYTATWSQASGGNWEAVKK